MEAELSGDEVHLERFGHAQVAGGTGPWGDQEKSLQWRQPSRSAMPEGTSAHRQRAAGQGWGGPTFTAWRLCWGRGKTFNGCTKLTRELGFKLDPSEPEGQASLVLTTFPRVPPP